MHRTAGRVRIARSSLNRRRGASFVKTLSFIDDGLWGFEVNDADGYVIAFFKLRSD